MSFHIEHCTPYNYLRSPVITFANNTCILQKRKLKHKEAQSLVQGHLGRARVRIPCPGSHPEVCPVSSQGYRGVSCTPGSRIHFGPCLASITLVCGLVFLSCQCAFSLWMASWDALDTIPGQKGLPLLPFSYPPLPWSTRKQLFYCLLPPPLVFDIRIWKAEAELDHLSGNQKAPGQGLYTVTQNQDAVFGTSTNPSRACWP